MVVVRGRLMPEVGAALRRALGGSARRRAEPGGSGRGRRGRRGWPGPDRRPAAGRRARDGSGNRAGRWAGQGHGDRYQVVVHVVADALTDAGDRPEPAETRARPGDGDATAGAATADGRDRPAAYVLGNVRTAQCGAGEGGHGGSYPQPRTTSPHATCPVRARRQSPLDAAGGIHVSAETARRPGRDAATVTMRHGHAGGVLSVGGRTRTMCCCATPLPGGPRGGFPGPVRRRWRSAVRPPRWTAAVGGAILPAVTDAPVAASQFRAGIRVGPHAATRPPRRAAERRLRRPRPVASTTPACPGATWQLS